MTINRAAPGLTWVAGNALAPVCQWCGVTECSVIRLWYDRQGRGVEWRTDTWLTDYVGKHRMWQILNVTPVNVGIIYDNQQVWTKTQNRTCDTGTMCANRVCGPQTIISAQFPSGSNSVRVPGLSCNVLAMFYFMAKPCTKQRRWVTRTKQTFLFCGYRGLHADILYRIKHFSLVDIRYTRNVARYLITNLLFAI